MVDIIGSAASQITSASIGVRNVDSVQAKREQVSGNTPSSSEAVDKVSISSEAMDIGRVAEVAQEAKALIKSDPQVTLSNDTERLSMLV